MKTRLASLLFSVSLLGFAPAVLAEDGYTPPPLGLHLDLVYKDTDYGDYYRQDDTVIAVGEDFALHRARGYYDYFSTEVEWEDYYAEFSGFYVHFCDGDLPSAEMRQTAFDLWPLEPGEKVKLGTDSYEWEYEVIGFGEAKIGRDLHATTIVKGTDLGDTEGYSETLTLSQRWNSYIGAQYDEWGTDIPVQATIPDRPLRMTDKIRSKLGGCEALLNETLPVQNKQTSQGE